MKSFVLFSFLIFLSWPIFLIVSFIFYKNQDLAMPSLWNFLVPISYITLGNYALHKGIKVPFIKKKEENTNFIFYALLFLNFFWSIHVSMEHDQSINGYFLVFSVGLIQVFQSTTALFDAKKTIISGFIQILLVVASYGLIYQGNFSIDDFLAIHCLWISILFFSFLNEIIWNWMITQSIFTDY